MKITELYKDMREIHDRGYDWELLRNRTVLITGAYGMLASYLVFFFIYLNKVHDMNVTIVCQGRSKQKMISRFAEYLECDFMKTTYISICREIHLEYTPDYIIHAASLANPSFYQKNPVEVEEPNVIGTYYLLRFAKECNIRGFLFFSSGDVYGKMESDITDISENMYGSIDTLDLHSCYGESKRMGETFCASFAREYYIPTRIARIGHTYGPTMDIENDPRVFASFLKNVINGENIVMLSDGSAKRPFCYLSDATAAFLLILLHGADGEAYNVCNTDQFLSISELGEIMVNLCPDKDLRVIKKERQINDNYLEAQFNKQNRPIEQKLINLGWDHKVTAREGFGRVLKILGY